MRRIFEVLRLVALCSCVGAAQERDSIIVPQAVLHYSIQGRGQPILLLSGGPGISSDQLSDLSRHLSRTYQCVLFDQRGTGRSHASPLDSTAVNLDRALKDIRLLLQRQRREGITIIGHSWGAVLAMSYAIKYPQDVAKLVLIGPGPLDLSGYDLLQESIYSKASKSEILFMNEAEDSIAHHTASPELVKAYNLTYLRFLFYDALTVDSLRGKIRADVNEITQNLMLQDLVRIKYDVKRGVSEINIPLLVICGREDPVGVFPTFLIRELNKQARICWIEKSGHFPWVENPKPFYAELFDFLK